MKPKKHKGQFSTYLKPILIMVFGFLLIIVLQTTLNFNLGLKEERQTVEFQTKPRTQFLDLSRCLSANQIKTGSSYVLNQSKLAEMERKNKYSEPKCAQNFGYGYTAEINQTFLQGIDSGRIGRPADVVFALDDSLSMGDYLRNVQKNTKQFMENLPPGSRVALFTYAEHGSRPRGPGEIGHKINLTSDTSKVVDKIGSIIGSTHCCTEAEDRAIQYAINNFSYRSSSRKIVVLLATEPATSNSDTERCGGPDSGSGAASPSCLKEWAEEANQKGVQIFTVHDQGAASMYKKISEITNAKSFSVNSDFSSIFGEITEKPSKFGGETTCTLPTITKYTGKSDLVIWGDASKGYSTEWNNICSSVNKELSQIKSKGKNLKISVYSPGQPGKPSNGVGKPMKISSNKKYSHKKGLIPRCVGKNAETTKYGQGITKWPVKPEYKPSKDFGLESWGQSLRYILKNHEYRSKTDSRKIAIFANHDPTGGKKSDNFNATFRFENKSNIVDTEKEIVANAVKLAEKKEVQLYFFTNNLQYQNSTIYGKESENDALELMKWAAKETGGKVINYKAAENIPQKLKKIYRKEDSSAKKGVCTNQVYKFGETRGTKPSNAEQFIQSKYQVSIYQSKKLTTPGTLTLKIKKAPLETLAGALDRITVISKRQGEKFEATIRIQNERTIEIGPKQIEKPEKTLYKVVDPVAGKSVKVDEDLIIGINGDPKFKDQDGKTSKIDFSKTKNQFYGYKGANIQVIALNKKKPRLHLDKLQLKCVNSCQNTQMLNDQVIDASEGTKKYQKLGGIGVYYHKFTTINIGKIKETTNPAVCYAGTQRCISLKATKTQKTSLKPGSHLLQVSYSSKQGLTIQK